MRLNPLRAVVIGTSAGALEALSIILPLMPRGYPLPILIVIHLPPDKKSVITELLQAKCELNVCEAEDKEPIQAGTVYLAPPDYHLLVEADEHLSLSNEEPVLYSRPSIDVLFETAADVYRDGLIGIVLSGGSSDGAEGLQAIIKAGGIGIVQQPDGAFSSIMPKAALALNPEAQVLSLMQIAEYLNKAITP